MVKGMQHRGVLSPHNLIFFCIASLLVMGLFVVPALAQVDSSGPPAETPATSSNTDNPNSPPNLIEIAARGCRVSEDEPVSVTLADNDGTQAKFVDGSGVEITATASQISIKITGNQIFSDVATFPDPADDDFDTGNSAGGLTVVTTTGISCQGTGTPADEQPADANAATDQYRTEGKEITVLVETIPHKKVLVDTGGPSLAMIGLLVLALGFVGLGILLLRRV